MANFSFLSSVEDVKLEFLSPILKRRLSKLDKVTVSTLNDIFNEKVENIIFSSHNGEYERLIKIISQYKELNEVSPNTFSGSVHNYPIGFFLLNKQKSIPYTALSFESGDISSGILAAISSNYSNNIFCYSDILDDGFVSMGFYFSKKKIENSIQYKITLKKNKVKEPSFSKYVALFENKAALIETPNYTLERISR